MPSTPTDQPKPSARRTSAHHPAVNSIGKGKTKAHEESPINSLPPELLAHCFALLPAGSLLAGELFTSHSTCSSSPRTATLVCKAWYHVATDETSWRSAFANYYGLPESGQLPGRRVDASSWKAEYLTRTRLIRRWIKSRNASLTYDAHAGGRISDLVVSLTDAMTVSIQGAAASRSDPTTSRILRTHIHPGGAPGQVTAARANERGQAIAWGCRDGDIRISLVCAPVSRPLSLSNLGTDATKHRGPVTALAFAPFPHASPPNRTTFASTAVDGIVKVWDTECTPPSACLFSSNPFERMRRDEGGDVDVGLALAYAPSQRTVAVGTEGGVLHAWRLDGQWQSRGYTRWTDGESETKPPIVQILLDTAAMTTTDSYSCLFRRMGASTFERLWLFGQAKKTRSYGIDSGTALTAVTVDFASPRNVVGFGAHKYVVTADEEAVVALYLWDDESTAKLTAPCKLLQKRSSAAAPVTALALSDLLVFVGRCVRFFPSAAEPR